MIACPLCKRPVDTVHAPVPGHPSFISGGLSIEEHSWPGVFGDVVDLTCNVKYSARCPMSGAPVEKI